MDFNNYNGSSWSMGKKICFRISFIFFLLYILLNPNAVFVLSLLTAPLEGLIHQFIQWVGASVLHLSYPITVFTSGSGDTTYDYVLLFTIVVLAVAGGLIWSLLDRNRPNYRHMYYWLRIIIRYYLAITMLSYGYAKLFKLQFPFPPLEWLMQRYGDSSPMRLAWSFMGYSDLYNYFTGGAEVLAGLLLFFRRTTLLGALLSFGVMGNVMVMNYSYDIPVKLLSTVCVVMSLYLMAEDYRRMYQFFFTTRSPEALRQLSIRELLPAYWMRICRGVLKVLVLGFFVVYGVKSSLEAQGYYGDRAPRAYLHGIYEVEEFVRNGEFIQPLLTDSTRWGKLIISYKDNALVKMTNDSGYRYAFKPDSVMGVVTLYSYADTSRKSLLHYERLPGGGLYLKGELWGDSVRVRLNRFDERRFRLISRGYHWVNEYPFNR